MFCYAALPLLRLLLFAPPLFLTSFIFFVGGKFEMTIIFFAAFIKKDRNEQDILHRPGHKWWLFAPAASQRLIYDVFAALFDTICL